MTHSHRLEVVQQPVRARMCGISDKDRRLVCPPPCVKLHVTSASGASLTRLEMESLDVSPLILVTELYSVDQKENVSVIQTSYQAPGLYNDPEDSSPSLHSRPFLASGLRARAEGGSETEASDENGATVNGVYYELSSSVSYKPNFPITLDGFHAPHPLALQRVRCVTPPPQSRQHSSGDSTVSVPRSHLPLDELENQIELSPERPAPHASHHSATETYDTKTPTIQYSRPHASLQPVRNLIGNLVSNAYKLNDDTGNFGVWFIIPDLSIRIEGEFRLKFSLVDLSNMSLLMIQHEENEEDEDSDPEENYSAGVLVAAFSEVFRVFSAKKFPGVLDTTPLSKSFAAQGIKIPVKKETYSKDAD
ncbi:hypothetical protein BABINDRAFT_162873 [Babjeviella inositovora NRRL Y-12698]|uniref:Velvet domain-containing protein n=1 Tax=Babjeviella inositovora NRRL Y-12698 TaxID=984486 RepID=A0A1E3QKR5_9ASCO|nr:uncharacterized protein BABINDRAFT_162873 [Babjeviella inositovora NRRL Y-12698]ODQ78208.1 hypothetical protein BABINDRAFT_162873 [Babjeviella inositovora NRRL Y-12698]